MLVAIRGAQHERFQTRVDDERRDGIDQLHFQQLDRRDLGQQQPPRIASAQIDLLQILIEPALGEKIAIVPILRQQRNLRELRGMRQTLRSAQSRDVASGSI